MLLHRRFHTPLEVATEAAHDEAEQWNIGDLECRHGGLLAAVDAELRQFDELSPIVEQLQALTRVDGYRLAADQEVAVRGDLRRRQGDPAGGFSLSVLAEMQAFVKGQVLAGQLGACLGHFGADFLAGLGHFAFDFFAGLRRCRIRRLVHPAAAERRGGLGQGACLRS